MPKSRKRKVRRGGASSKATYSSRRKSKRTKIIVFAIIGALVIATLIFLFTRGGGSSSPTGVEVTTASGLKYTDEIIGDGISPRPGQTVVVHYTGKLENGTVFDSSVQRNKPEEFQIGVGRVIKGWDEGLITMKVGGKRRLVVPPEIGYGPAGNPDANIPPYSTLIFDVELLGVK